MSKTTLFTIIGQPMCVPDENVSVSYQDLDASDAGRDEAGFMHRIVVRHKVATWSFQFSAISEADRRYMESLFPEAGTFLFGHPDRLDSGKTAVCRAYRSGYSLSWKNARTGDWRNYSFNIIAC